MKNEKINDLSNFNLTHDLKILLLFAIFWDYLITWFFCSMKKYSGKSSYKKKNTKKEKKHEEKFFISIFAARKLFLSSKRSQIIYKLFFYLKTFFQFSWCFDAWILSGKTIRYSYQYMNDHQYPNDRSEFDFFHIIC